MNAYKFLMKKLFKNVLVGGLIAGATALVGVGSFYVNRANASIDIQENKKQINNQKKIGSMLLKLDIVKMMLHVKLIKLIVRNLM